MRNGAATLVESGNLRMTQIRARDVVADVGMHRDFWAVDKDGYPVWGKISHDPYGNRTSPK